MKRRVNPQIADWIIWIFIAVVLIGSVFITGCKTIEQQANQVLSPQTTYRRDMIITVNGVTREGVITMPMKAQNTVYIVAPGDLDMFATVNCMGEQVKPKAWNQTTTIKSGLFGWSSKTIDKKREIEFTYTPAGLEKLGSCPLELYGFAKDGKHSWGFIDFQTDTFTLNGTMTCNSVTRAFEGVEACQSREGLFQQLSFTEEVFMSPDPGCELDKTTGKDFTFKMPKGKCVYRIKSRDTGSLGKLTLIGYDGILIRE